MPLGDLVVSISDLLSRPMTRRVDVEVRREPTQLGAGGGNLLLRIDPAGVTRFSIGPIPTRGGPGSLHDIRLTARGYRMFVVRQFITEGDQGALTNVYMVVNPNHVAGIAAPPWEALGQDLRDWLDSAEMVAPANEDKDLAGKKGKALYDALGDERKAAALNIHAKARHRGTTGDVFRFFGPPMVIRRDRCFVRVKPEVVNFVTQDSRYVAAPNSLHKPLEGFKLSNSVKSDDPHANIQLTFQMGKGDALAADVDIDESSGFGHWGEVLRNFFKNNRTNPYTIHQLLLASDVREQTLRPAYDLILNA